MWLRLDDSFTDHPKVLSLGGYAERWAWLELLCYCARFSTDGYVPSNLIGYSRHITRGLVDRALSVGLLELDDAGSLRVHDWEMYQPPRDSTAAVRQQRWRDAHNNGA